MRAGATKPLERTRDDRWKDARGVWAAGGARGRHIKVDRVTHGASAVEAAETEAWSPGDSRATNAVAVCQGHQLPRRLGDGRRHLDGLAGGDNA